jgi:hypothetical protein
MPVVNGLPKGETQMGTQHAVKAVSWQVVMPRLNSKTKSSYEDKT